MQTIKEFLMFAIEEDHTLLAHSLFIAIQKKIVSPNDSIDDLDLRTLPAAECIEANEKNILDIHPVKLYAVPLQNDFAMYFARNETEVKNTHYKKFRAFAAQIFDMTEKMHTDVYDEDTRVTESFKDIQKRIVDYPAFICTMPKRRK